MKNSIIPIALVVLLSACGGKEEAKTETTNEQELNGATLLQDEGPVYDRNAINPDAPVVTFTVKAVGNSMAEMKYDQTALEIAAGSTVKLTLISETKEESMPHNWVLVKKGSAERVASKAIEAGPDKNYVPVSDDVLVATSLLKPGGKEEITFPAPVAGEYIFICTYPGHWQQMQGTFTVK
jgi:azurin